MDVANMLSEQSPKDERRKMDPVLLRNEVTLEASGVQRDPILYWNEVSLEANRVSHTTEPKEQAGPTLSSRALAIVHLSSRR